MKPQGAAPQTMGIIIRTKTEEHPMSDKALDGLFWAGVIVLTLAVWIFWYMVLRT